MARDDQGLPHSDDELRDIGAAIVAWNDLEQAMVLVVAKALAVTNECGVQILNTTSIVAQVAILTSVASCKLSEPLRETVEKIGKRINDLSNFRAEIAHGIWWEELRYEDLKWTSYAERKGKPSRRYIESIPQKTAEIKKARLSLLEIARHLPSAPTPSLDKS